MKKIIVIVSVVGTLALAFTIVWMNRYRYEKAGYPWQVVRVNRFTSQVCYSQPDGTWNSNLTAPSKAMAQNKEHNIFDSVFAGEQHVQNPDKEAAKNSRVTPPPGFVLDTPKQNEFDKLLGEPANTCK